MYAHRKTFIDIGAIALLIVAGKVSQSMVLEGLKLCTLVMVIEIGIGTQKVGIWGQLEFWCWAVHSRVAVVCCACSA